MTDAEPYTKIPNALLDTMDQLGHAELRVLLTMIRKTAGWGKECDVISVSQIATATGLTTRNTQRAIESLLKRGMIERKQAGKQTYCYTVKPYPVGTRLDHIPTEPISLGDTVPYPVGTQLEVKPYPLGITQKKEYKEKKERDVAPRKARAQRPPKDDTTPAVVRAALADVCGLDLTICSKEQAINVNSIAKRLHAAGEKAGKTPDETADTIRYVARWYEKNDWRGKKGDRPTPKALVDNWGAAIKARRPATNGHIPIVTNKPDQQASIKALGEAARQRLKWKDE